MSGFVSAIYAGAVTHRRLAPRRHHLRYSMFQMLLDLDEASALSRRLRLFSHDRFNLFSFHDRDHGDGRPGPVRAYVEEILGGAGILLEGGPIRILCMPRILGHVFNPLSLYYCHRPDGALAAMLYEVNNTFGQRHSYLIAVPPGAESPILQSCDKAFHVSPFMDMAMTYDFTVTTPLETIATTVSGRTPDGAPILVATFRGRRRDLSDRRLVETLFAYPLLTFKVVAAIHFEALKLILKGLRPRAVPPAPAKAVSVG
ncbi:MAG: DUF1365 domain-containing protein [Caulobacteraceae bacterium]